MRALAMRQTSDRRQACGANQHGGGGLGQPPADAIEASALRRRLRRRERLAARGPHLFENERESKKSPPAKHLAELSFLFRKGKYSDDSSGRSALLLSRS